MDNKNEDGETFDDNDIIFKRKGSIKNLVRKSVTVQQKAVKRIMSLKQRKNIFFQDEYWKKRNEVYKLYHSRESLEELHICPYIKELNMYLFRHRGSAPEILSKTKTISKPCSSLDFNNILYEHQNCHHFAVFSCLIQPYMVSVEKSQSGKDIICVKPSISHALATKVFAQKIDLFDDTKNNSNCSVDSLTGTLSNSITGRQDNDDISRHVSPSRFSKQLKSPELYSNIQHNIINLIEAVSAVEQDDINNLNNITSNHVFDINQPLNCGFYREFGFQLNLLDVALMLE